MDLQAYCSELVLVVEEIHKPTPCFVEKRKEKKKDRKGASSQERPVALRRRGSWPVLDGEIEMKREKTTGTCLHIN